MSTIDSSGPPSPIQRILIFHLNLPEKCSNGKSLGEGASLQELSEQILYYHQDRRRETESSSSSSFEDQNNEISKLNPTEEAVQLLGLCTALYSLPSSLGDTTLTGDRTDKIYFGNSTLVIPLELSEDLLCIVQILRLCQNGSKSDSGGGNPLVIRASIERRHKLFCMLKGGGILRRLEGKQLQLDRRIQDVCSYPGMDRLFMLQKDLRRAGVQLSRQDK
jgi:hypothetical protein